MSRRAILLDALGTLLVLEPPAPRLAAVLGLSLPEAQRAIAAEIRFYRAHLGEGRDAVSLAALRRRCAAVLRDALPPERTAGLSLDAVTKALLESIEFTPFPDVRPALVAARARGYRLVVASNWDISLHEVLERLQLARLVDGIATSAQAGAPKPATPVFELALALAGAPAAVHVGDSLDEDVAGARNAGIEPVLLRRDGSPGPAGVRTIESLKELDRVAP
jgi:putative hydrolase of the HAD superfamily